MHAENQVTPQLSPSLKVGGESGTWAEGFLVARPQDYGFYRAPAVCMGGARVRPSNHKGLPRVIIRTYFSMDLFLQHIIIVAHLRTRTYRRRFDLDNTVGHQETFRPFI